NGFASEYQGFMRPRLGPRGLALFPVGARSRYGRGEGVLTIVATINRLMLTLAIRARNLRQNVKGQDLIEYALMAGFVAVAAGALMPNIASSISTVFSTIS